VRAKFASTDSLGAEVTSVRHAALLRRLAAASAIVGGTEVIGILLLASRGDARFRMGADVATIGFLASVGLFSLVGALIVQRRPTTRVAWLMIVIGLSFGVALITFGYGSIGLPPAEPLPWAAAALILAQPFFVPVPATAIAFLVLLFPTDRLLGRRWVIVGIIASAGSILYGLGIVFHPGAIDPVTIPGLENPFGAPAGWAGLLDLMIVLGNTMVTLAIALGALSLVVRYRRADRIEAAQIRWIALVAGLAAPTLAVAALQRGGLSEDAFGVGLVLLACMPIAIGVAITRYHLYDIDRLINRALVYGSLTAILAGVFTAAIGLAQRMFVAITGETSDAAIVLTTLVVATLYAPLRKRLESIIDRRFKFDVRRFGLYRSELEQVLSVLQPRRAAQRLATEAAAELDAIGAAVLDADGLPTASAGRWPAEPTVRLPIAGGGHGLATLVIGPRVDGQLHNPRAVAELEDMVGLVAAALTIGHDSQR
jgi:hypothetical protein